MAMALVGRANSLGFFDVVVVEKPPLAVFFATGKKRAVVSAQVDVLPSPASFSPLVTAPGRDDQAVCK